MIVNISWIVASYLLASIPFGLIITKYFFGFDVRTKGSGNIGMTNVMRTAGKLPGALTFFFDFAKGAIVLWLYRLKINEDINQFVLLMAVLAVLGHTKSIFLRFRGGKGVATNFGVWLAIDWKIFATIGSIWLLVFLITKISSLSAIVSLTSLPISTFFLGPENMPLFYTSILIGSFVLFLHKENIIRLLNGNEKQLQSNKDATEKS